MDENKRVIEIGGVKMEVDLRHARVVENFRIGDTVKVLKKTYSSYESLAGVIIGFDDFRNLPTIVLATVETDHTSANVKIIYFNKESKDVEICPMSNDERALDKAKVVEVLDRKITEKEALTAAGRRQLEEERQAWARSSSAVERILRVAF